MSRQYAIILGDRTWELHALGDRSTGERMPTLSVDAMPDWEQTVACVVSRLTELGMRPAPVALLLPTHWCLCATMELPRRRRLTRETLLYRLEEELPVASEDLIADFCRSEMAVLGVAALQEPLTSIVRALEAAAFEVDHVGPIVTAALQQVIVSNGEPLPDLVIWREADRTHVLELSGGSLLRWVSVPPQPTALRRALRCAASSGERPRALCLGPDVAATEHQVAENADVQAVLDLSLTDQAVDACDRILAGECRPWIDLRRGAPDPPGRWRRLRQPIGALACAIVFLLLSTAAAMLWRAREYDRTADRVLEQQRQAFAVAFPGQPIPAQVLGRLRSEARLAASLATGGPEAGAAGDPDATFRFFRDVLNAVPRDLRLQVHELRLEPQKLYVEGRVRSHGDAEVLAGALRQAGFDVAPPRSEQRGADGVWFTLSGVPVAPEVPGLARSHP